MIVESARQQWQRPAQMRGQDTHPRITHGDTRQDQMHDRHRVLDRSSDHPRHVVPDDERAGGPFAGRVDVQDGTAPVELLVEGFEERVGECAAEYGRGHADTDRAEVVQGMDGFTQGRVDMGEGQRGEGAEAPGETAHQLCVRLVRRSRQRHGVGFARQVRGLRCHGEHLKVDAGLIHQCETAVQIGLGGVGADSALGVGIGLPQSFEAVQVRRGPQMGVHIDTQMGHPSMKRPPRGAGQSAVRASRVRRRSPRPGVASPSWPSLPWVARGPGLGQSDMGHG